MVESPLPISGADYASLDLGQTGENVTVLGKNFTDSEFEKLECDRASTAVVR
jgi:hypothetical protein